jgi:predicted  nucleic acid-binding Zn-ribbon protein
MVEKESKKEEMKPCPLCGAMLLYDKWLRVVDVYEEQQKYRKQLELELNKAKEQEKKLKEEYKKFKIREKELQE